MRCRPRLGQSCRLRMCTFCSSMRMRFCRHGCSASVRLHAGVCLPWGSPLQPPLHVGRLSAELQDCGGARDPIQS